MSTYSYSTSPHQGYSNKYSTLQQHHLDQLREEVIGQREDVSVKNKKLSAETNKRRRELINKKKARETEEEKRRKEILAERKARIQDVTYRYQRGSAPKTNTSSHHHHHHAKSPRSRRAVSAPVTRHNQINLDDALNSIRGNSQLQQYNVGDSGAMFLQKYGAHLNPTSSGNTKVNSTDATPAHSQSVRDVTNNTNQSLFEQQLAQHQAIIHQTKTADRIQTHNERLMNDLTLHDTTARTQSLNNLPPEDSRSIESLDSLESAQPSTRSHALNSQPATNSDHHTSAETEEGGSGTYRQESPSVLIENHENHRHVANTISSKPARAQSAPTNRHSNRTQATPTTDPNNFLGFHVVNTTDFRQKRTNPPRHPYTDNIVVDRIAAENTPNHNKIQSHASSNHQIHSHVSNQTIPTRETDSNRKTDENGAYYLKSRTESQTLVTEFPPQAWGTPDNSSRQENSIVNIPQQHQMSISEFVAFDNPSILSEGNTNQNNSYADTFSDTASDCGAPRSILKRRGSGGNLARSQSTPSIRDSLEVAKQHTKKSGGKPETPKSAKKSVRFTTFGSEPVLFQKGSSPSSIPRPARQQPSNRNSKPPSGHSNNNVPHITSAITPSVSDKPIPSKQSNGPTHRGPVVAKHDINVTNSAGSSKPCITDIRLDRTPTDDEIDVLWDRVRDCLQETPTGSARSAPPDLQTTPNDRQPTAPNQHNNNSSLPPKQPIKKITASNINQIGRTTGPASQRGRSGSDPNLHIQSTLQRPKLNQTSFISQPEHIKAHNQLVNGFHSTLPGYSGDNHMTNGHVTVGKTTPIQSSNEPHISHMVNNSPQNVTESMMSYLTAEALAGHDSMTDQDIMRAMSDTDYRQTLPGNNGRPMVPMSALSMEEQRILQSLDRLNNKLRVVEDSQNSSRSNKSDYQHTGPVHNGHNMSTHNHIASTGAGSNVFTNPLTSHRVQLKPHPPNMGHGPRSFSATPRGFRGHKPIQPRQRSGSSDGMRIQNGSSMSTQQNGGIMSAQNSAIPANNSSGSNRQFRLY